MSLSSITSLQILKKLLLKSKIWLNSRFRLNSSNLAQTFPRMCLISYLLIETKLRGSYLGLCLILLSILKKDSLKLLYRSIWFQKSWQVLDQVCYLMRKMDQNIEKLAVNFFFRSKWKIYRLFWWIPRNLLFEIHHETST